MGNSWKFSELMRNVLASALEADQDQAIEEFVSMVVDVDALLDTIGVDDVMVWLGENYRVDQLFTDDEVIAFVDEKFGINMHEILEEDSDGRF